VLGAVAVTCTPFLPYCARNFAVLREFEDQPSPPPLPPIQTLLCVDGDAVVRRGPLIAVAVAAAPVAQQVALLIELEDRRRLAAALAGFRVGAASFGLTVSGHGRSRRDRWRRRPTPIDIPDTSHRQRFGVRRIDLEAWHLILSPFLACASARLSRMP